MKTKNGKTAALIGLLFLVGTATVGCKETTKEETTVVPGPAGDTGAPGAPGAPAPQAAEKTTESTTSTTNSTSPGGDTATTTEKSTTQKTTP